MFRIFTAECRRALAVLDAGQGVNEVILAVQAAAEERIERKKVAKGRAEKNSEKVAPSNPGANVEKLPPPLQTPVSSVGKEPENVVPRPSPAPEPSAIPSIRPPQPAQVGASGSNKRRKTRAKKRQIPAASNIPTIPESQPAPST